MYFQRMGSGPASTSDAVYSELVETLHSTVVPVVLSATAQAVTGIMLVWLTGDVAIAGSLTTFAVIIAISRLSGILLYRRRVNAKSPLSLAETRRYGRRYAFNTIAAALVVGLFIARSLMLDNTVCAIVAMGIGFGFGNGVIARLSLVPVVAGINLALLGLPAMVVCFASKDTPHVVMGALIMIYYLDSFEMVRRTFNSTLTHITLKHQFERSARIDPLTGLLNRSALTSDLPDIICNSRGMVAVYAIDLDHFKAANDRFGHPVGDALLTQVAGRLIGASGPGSLIIRMGGDEFILVDTAMRSRDGAAALAEHILTSVSAPYQVGGHTIAIGVSIGVAMSPDHGPSGEILLSRADKALYRAKVGRGGYAFADEISAEADPSEVQIVARAPELVPAAA